MPELSQETLAIISVGIGLAALILTSTAGIRGELRDVRSEIRDIRDEARTDRESFQNHTRSVRDEARADRETLRSDIRNVRGEARADRETFQSHILRLTEQQGILGARLDGASNPPPAAAR